MKVEREKEEIERQIGETEKECREILKGQRERGGKEKVERDCGRERATERWERERGREKIYAQV